MKKAKTLLLAGLLTATGVLTSCSKMDPVKYTFEAEKALLADNEGQEQNTIQVVEDATLYEDDENTATFIEYFGTDGQTVTFVITSDRDVDAKLTLVAAACTMEMAADYSSFGIKSFDPAEADFEFTLNDKEFNFTGTLEGIEGLTWGDIMNQGIWHKVGTLTANVKLVKGENKIVLATKGTSLNVDKLEVEAAAKLTMAEHDNSERVPQPAEQA